MTATHPFEFLLAPHGVAPRRFALRLIDQRQQQIDPAGRHRVDPNEVGPKRSQKQPGQDLHDPQEGDEDAE